MPKHLIRVPKTYITESFELFILGESLEKCEMYMVDLDNF